MLLSERLGIRPGVTAVIGGGGKTTLLRTLGTELAADGARVLLCTTTKIFPFDGLPKLPVKLSVRSQLSLHCRFLAHILEHVNYICLFSHLLRML